jgi:hypothetical protein
VRLLEGAGCAVIGARSRPHAMVGGVRFVGATSRLNPKAMLHGRHVVQPDEVPFEDGVPTVVYVHWGYEYMDEPDSQTQGSCVRPRSGPGAPCSRTRTRAALGRRVQRP